MKKNDKKSMDELIMEEVERNPILTKEELAELLYFPTEEEIRKDELMTEAVCKRIELYQKQLGDVPSEKQLNEIIAEERIKRENLL